MVESFLYMELPFDYISLEFDSYLDKPEEISYSDGGNEIILEISKIIEPHFKDYFQTSFQKLIPEISIIEVFTIKSTKLALYFLIFIIEIKLSESKYIIDDLIDKMLKWFPLFFDFYPEVPRLERIITNIPINKTITDKMVGHFMSLFSKKKIRSLTIADYKFKSFIFEYPRLSNSNILLTLYKILYIYYQNRFKNYPISIHPFNFYGKITKRESSDYITIFKELVNEFHSYLISLYSYIGEDMEDFLSEMETFRYKITPIEFEKLIKYEQYFEEIFEKFFSNEIPEWCRERFEKWVFEHHKDKDFSVNKPVMIFRLPRFPKAYLKLRARIREILNNIKHLLLSKSKKEIGQKEYSTNRIVIIKSLIKCIYQFQQKIQSIQKSEDHYSGILSTFINNLINNRGWHIEEQKPSGISPTAEKRKFDHIGGLGNLDFVFIDEKNMLLTICEALILNSNVKMTIEEHLLKIFKYDTIGLPFNFIIIYSKAVKFEDLWSNYQETVLKTPFKYKLKENQFYDESDQYNINSESRLGKTIHIRQGKLMDLYHFLINTNFG